MVRLQRLLARHERAGTNDESSMPWKARAYRSENTTRHVGDLPEIRSFQQSPLPLTLVSAVLAAVMPKRLLLLLKEELFHCHFLVRVNYESIEHTVIRA